MRALVQSRYAQMILVRPGKWLLYHSLFGNPRLISETARRIFEQHRSTGVPGNSANTYEAPTQNIVRQLREAFLLVPDGFDERSALFQTREGFKSRLEAGKKLYALSLVVSDQCNYTCPHCLPVRARSSILKKHRATVGAQMESETAHRCIDSFFAITTNHRDTRQIFFGGREPLMNWPVVQDTIQYASDVFPGPPEELQFIIFSNCSLLTPSMVDFLSLHNVYVASSMDGTKEFNDLHRIGPEKSSAFEATLRGWRLLCEAGILVEGLSCTMSKKNIAGLNDSFIEFLKEWGKTSVSVNVDETSMQLGDVPHTVEAILSFRSAASEEGIEIGGQWKIMYDNLFRNVSNSINCGFCSAFQGHTIAIRPDGTQTVCSSSTEYLGQGTDLERLAKSPTYLDKVVSMYSGTIEECMGCDIEGLCMGGCPISHSTAIHRGLNGSAHCEFFKQMFLGLLKSHATQQILLPDYHVAEWTAKPVSNSKGKNC